MSSQFDAFAAREPYFAVLTAPRFLRANLTPEHEREFFVSGEEIVTWIFNVIEAGLSPQFAPISILEYGCGIGRLALPLARQPGSVTAVDRSPVMLDLARREAERAGLGHIVFETPEQLFARPRKFDLVVCYHVLQRLPPREGHLLLTRLIDLISPNGVGVFQWPYRSDASPRAAFAPGQAPAGPRVTQAARQTLVRASRWARERVPGANALVNRLRGRPAADPFIATHLYQLDEMLPAFDAAGFRSTHVVYEQQQDLGYAIVLAQKPERAAPGRSRAVTGTVEPRPVARTPGAMRANTVVPDADIDAYNRAAEHYFSSLTGWDHHLAKPFSHAGEAPAILMNVAILLQGLDLTPGTRVLDFGGGSGWLSRYLTQLGCRVTLLDVSATALEMARELYRRLPVIGVRPSPEFLEFDGRRIALPDASIDRIICCDAFHHAPNPDTVIAEFARILAPGGIAGFAEPGPRHSESARSQFEAQTYGVIERDVDIHQIWRTAQASGFRELRMAVFHEPPYHVSLEEYEDLIGGGLAQERWQASVRGFLHHARSFFLVKAGVEPADSRHAGRLACEIVVAQTGDAGGPVIAVAGRPILIDVTVRNTGTATWLPSADSHGAVWLGAHLYDESNRLVDFEAARAPLGSPPRPVGPGESIDARLSIGPLGAGRHRIELDLVADNVAWFAQAGSRPVDMTIEVLPGDEPNAPDTHVSPSDVISRYTVEELAETADEYYRRVTDPTPLMSKPFTYLHEASEMLQNLGLLLSGLHLGKTMTVLDFGAGTAWLSRILAQLNCRPIACDVSTAALEIGKRLFAEHPLIGTAVYAPVFLHFDGHRIDLPDASVDRILCFDAFHHVPNPDEVIREFGRVLVPGGIAGFSEPGRLHARSAQSQYEMVNHRVLENDIDLNAIFAQAQSAGFTALTVKLLGDLEVSLDQYNAMAADGPGAREISAAFWRSSREATLNKSIFFLHKGSLRRDSRSHEGLAHTIVVDQEEIAVPEGEPLRLALTITNTGTATWLDRNSEIFGIVRLATHLYDATGKLIEIDHSRHELGGPVPPGQTVRLEIAVPLPATGSFRVALDLVAEGVTWFENVGSTPVVLQIVRT